MIRLKLDRRNDVGNIVGRELRTCNWKLRIKKLSVLSSLLWYLTMSAEVTDVEIWRDEISPQLREWLDEHDEDDLLGQCMRRLEILDPKDLFRQYRKPTELAKQIYMYISDC